MFLDLASLGTVLSRCGGEAAGADGAMKRPMRGCLLGQMWPGTGAMTARPSRGARSSAGRDGGIAVWTDNGSCRVMGVLPV